MGVTIDHTSGAGLPPNDQNHHYSKGYMQTVKTSQNIKGASKKIGRESKGQLEVFQHLTCQKSCPHSCGDQQPQATTKGIAEAQFPGRTVECQATYHQQGRVDSREQKLKLINTAGGQRIYGSKGEIGRKQPGKGHAIADKKKDQTKHPEIAVMLLVIA
jgi:hypothetical protein